MVNDIKWTTVTSDEVKASKLRLDANVFNIEAKKAKQDLSNCKFPIINLTGDNGIASAYHRLRFKRVFVAHSNMPIFQPSQITEISPKAQQFISYTTNTDIESLRVKNGQILMTCSGTIGKITLTSKTLENKIFSHDLIRITAKNPIDTGLIYAFCKSRTGQLLLTTNNYGAVIQHIEPEHLEDFLLPYPNEQIRQIINEKILQSFSLRDKSNQLLDEAEKLLISSLSLPAIETLKPNYFDKKVDVKNYCVPLNELCNRFDSTYHNPIVEKILDSFFDSEALVRPLNEFAKDIYIPGRFKRIYLEEHNSGVPFFSGRCIHELDPSNKKYISALIHKDRIGSQLTIKENMLLITCSGTTGKVCIVPEHWDNWVMTHDIVRLIPTSIEMTGYIYVFLNSDFGRILLQRSNYGSVVQHIEVPHVQDTPIAIPKDQEKIKQINDLALDANRLRAQAYYLEQEAIRIINEEVIFKES